MMFTKASRNPWVDRGKKDQDPYGDVKDWVEIEGEVREEMRRLEMTTVGYDDVSALAEDGAPDRPDSSSLKEEKPEEKEENEEEEEQEEKEQKTEQKEAVVTAGQQEREKKRGGLRKTGAHRRREAREAEADLLLPGTDQVTDKAEQPSNSRKRRSEDAQDKDKDQDRWVKMRLEGEEKTKRIDATRVVSYFDFDRGGRGTRVGTKEARERDGPEEGNFRAAVRRDLWEDSDDSEG